MGASAVTKAAPPRRGPLAGVSARLLRIAPDDKLVELVRAGNQPAFEVVYDRHHRGILSFCRHMVGSREEAEDALQHTFMAAYKDLVGSDKDIQLRAWLYTIARNRCLSVLRARREQPSDEIEIASTEGLAAEVQRRVDLQDMLRDLHELPEEQRAALVLSELGDLGHDEIAGILGCPKDKVKALVFQARSSLQQSREARDTSCEQIREMLSTLSGGSLRRTTLRRHLRDCDGCRAFEAEVKRQRRAMAAVLPVVPTLALKDSVLAATFGGAQAAAGGAAAGGVAAVAGSTAVAGGGASAIVAKVLVVAAVAGGGAVGADAVRTGGGSDAPAPVVKSSPPPPAVPAAGAAIPDAADEASEKAEGDKPRKSRRGRGHTDRGKEFAKSRGKGKKRGLHGTQPGKARPESKEKKARLREDKGNDRAKNRTRRVKSERTRPAPKPVRKARPAPRATPKPKPAPEPKAKPQSTPESTPEPDPTPAPEPTP